MKRFFLLIHGPTGVGKTETILSIGKELPIEIINCDVGQLYEPLSIGTAKPDWKNEPIPHHFFDVVSTPVNFSVMEYREQVTKLIDEINARGNIPVLVGGSLFYGKSLFFPPSSHSSNIEPSEGTWDQLYKIDKDRAEKIHSNDVYRIQQALAIIQSTGQKASLYKPIYDPISVDCLVVYLHKNRSVLYDSINKRTEIMMQQGWIQEAEHLKNTDWEVFLKKKKLIGYPEIYDYLEDKISRDILISTIQKKTRNYAKRQETFWRMFKKNLEPYISSDTIIECDLLSKDATSSLCKVINMLFLKKRNMYEK